MQRTGSERVQAHWSRAIAVARGTTVATALFMAAALPLANVAWAATAPAAPEAVPVPPGAMEEQATAPAATPVTALERIRATGTIRLGYVDGARPYSYRDESGNAAGYSVVLCQHIADQVKTDLAMPELSVEWVAQTFEQRFADVEGGRVDIECAAGVASLADREKIAFSIPVFPGSVGALLRKDASSRLKELLEEGPPHFRPFWRASPAQLLGEQTFATIPGSRAERFLEERTSTLRLTSVVIDVADVAAGVRSVLDRKAEVFFADRALLLDAARRDAAAEDLVVLDRKFTYQPIALGVARGDEDMRLLVDRTLSRMVRSGELQKAYEASFGEADETTLDYLRMSALPE